MSNEKQKKRSPTSDAEKKRDERKYGLTPTKELAYAMESGEYMLGYIAEDPLTGAASLSEFNTQLEQALKMVHRDIPVSLLYIDIDRFKSVNDTFGHPAGDAVLKNVCDFLMSAVRESDVVARIGGGEFAVILIGADGFGTKKAEELRAGIEKLSFLEYQELSVTASFGVVSLADVSDAHTAKANADAALSKAKQRGNQVEFYNGL